MAGPTLPNLDVLFQAGIDPRTGLPVKFGGDAKPFLKENIRKTLRVLDEQNAINRYKWYNLPSGIDGQLLERILYYKGQAAFFYMETDDNFYFLPYALDGTIDVYGRYTGITPLPFNGSASTVGKEKPWITGLNRKPIYSVIPETQEELIKNGCVLLNDYSKQISQTILSRQSLQDPILDAMAEAFPLARTSLIANSGIKGMRVQNEDQASTVKAASRSLTKAALEGDPWIPMVAEVDFQDLTNSSALKSEEYLLYLQALDNYRLSLYGVGNGGLFQKKSHMLEAEQDMNSGKVKSAYMDGLILRQRFCDIVNSIWGLGIWCDKSDEYLESESSMQIVDETEQPKKEPSSEEVKNDD